VKCIKARSGGNSAEEIVLLYDCFEIDVLDFELCSHVSKIASEQPGVSLVITIGSMVKIVRGCYVERCMGSIVSSFKSLFLVWIRCGLF